MLNKTCKKASFSLILFLLVGLLLGCGFKLRGQLTAPVKLPPTFVVSDVDADLSDLLVQSLLSSGSVIVDKKDAADYILSLSNESRTKRVLSIDSHGKANEFQLFYSVDVLMMSALGKTMLPLKNIKRLGVLSFKNTDVLASAIEEDQVYGRLKREVVRNIIFTLSTMKFNE